MDPDNVPVLPHLQNTEYTPLFSILPSHTFYNSGHFLRSFYCGGKAVANPPPQGIKSLKFFGAKKS